MKEDSQKVMHCRFGAALFHLCSKRLMGASSMHLRPTGFAHDQVVGEADAPALGTGLAGDPLEEQLRGDAAHGLRRLIDHREEGRDDREVLNVVEADERDVVRHLQPGLTAEPTERSKLRVTMSMTALIAARLTIEV